MNSLLAERLYLKHQPAAILFSDEKPSRASEFVPGRWGCAAAMLTAATRGAEAAFSLASCTCHGARNGLCLSAERSAGMDYFMTCGHARSEGQVMPGKEPQGYKKDVATARATRLKLPLKAIGQKYVVFRPLAGVEPEDAPRVVVMYANPDQLAALVSMANFAHPGYDNVMAPSGSACMTFCLLAEHENAMERPRAVISMTDVFARKFIEPDLLAFAMPWRLFQEMEASVPGSFLERRAWRSLACRVQDASRMKDASRTGR